MENGSRRGAEINQYVDEAELLYQSLVKSLTRNLGEKTAAIVLYDLECEKAVENNKVRIDKVEEVLIRAFGCASFAIISRSAKF